MAKPYVKELAAKYKELGKKFSEKIIHKKEIFFGKISPIQNESDVLVSV